MTIATDLTVGAIGGVSSFSVSRNVEAVELSNGFIRYIFPRSESFSVSVEKTYTGYQGIYPALAAAGFKNSINMLFTSASYTWEDDTTEPSVGIDDAADGTTDTSLAYTYAMLDGVKVLGAAEAMVWKGHSESVTFSGLMPNGGAIPASAPWMAQGGRFPSFADAEESFSLVPFVGDISGLTTEALVATACQAGTHPVIGATVAASGGANTHFMVEENSAGGEALDAHTFGFTMRRYVHIADEAAVDVSPILSKCALIMTGAGAGIGFGGATAVTTSAFTNLYTALGSPTYYRLSRTLNLSADGSPTESQSITVFPTAGRATGHTLVTT